MYTKKNTRMTYKSNRRPSFKRNNSFSNGKGWNKGSVIQLYNKYLKLAKEAFTSGDRIQSEYYYQFTDHYYRLMVELGINIDENQINLDSKIDSFVDNQATQSINVQEASLENNNIDQGTKPDAKDEADSVESIESISFIAEPSKKKET